MNTKPHAQIMEERRARRAAKAAQAEAAKNGEKSAYHQQINDLMRKRFSPSDETAILRHAVIIMADVLIQKGFLTAKDLEELLAWNSLAVEAKNQAKAAENKGE